jgi:uncharacterized SAM-binding protein YcdF (DUF218 family)
MINKKTNIEMNLTVLIVILGSHIDKLLENRVNVALQFIKENNYEDVEFEYFLTGGNKNINNEISEAEKMLNKLLLNETKYYIDDISENTVENFYYVSKHIEKKKYFQIIICTSEFHYLRANKILNYFISNHDNIGWILGKEMMDDSNSNEFYHINNIENDIEKLKKKKILL